MDIPLYVAIPFAVVFVHYDNNRRAWRWAWARVKRWWRASTASRPHGARRDRYFARRSAVWRRKMMDMMPPPPPYVFPNPPDRFCGHPIQQGSDLPLSKMTPLVVPVDIHIENVPADVVVIRVANASQEKMARVAAQFRKWQLEAV